MEIWTAIAIGFFGSFHCIGMCGPIAMTLPGHNDSALSLLFGRFLYNMGRVVTYSLLGALFGLVGHSVVIAGFQRSLSVLLGVLIIISALSQSRAMGQWKQKLGLHILFDKLKTGIGAQYQKRGGGALFTVGMLNGLLPCGFVYIGLAGSVTTGSLVEGSVFMALFGLGTLPAMMAMSLAPSLAKVAKVSLRQRINRIMPFLAVVMGLYLIYRGISIFG